MNEWPKMGVETYLKAIYDQNIHRCKILARGTIDECNAMLGNALYKTLIYKCGDIREFSAEFRVRSCDLIQKREIDIAVETDRPSKRSRNN